MASEEASRLDIVIFGATGVTGQSTVRKLLEFSRDIGSLKWGVAGRNENKLNAVLSELSKKTSDDLSKIRMTVADVSDDESLKKMAGQYSVVINCVGPFIFYGEQVVKACIEMGAHYVDVTGESQFMEKMQLQYHEQAREKGVYIVSACGVDSVPADLGTVFLTNNFQGDVNSVEAYVKFSTNSLKWGPSINYGSLHSAVYLMSEVHVLKEIRRKLFNEQLPSLTPALEYKWFVHKNKEIGGWSVPFPGPDRSVVQRSQRYFYLHERQRPVQIYTYITFSWLVVALIAWIIGSLFLLLIKTSFGKYLILKYPRLMSAGMVGINEISEEVAENVNFSLYLYGKGWKDKLLEPSDQHKSAPNKKIVARVSGSNPGYGATCIAVIWAAFTVLQEVDKMPSSGGVYPPGAAFGRTSLIDNLNRHGLRFEIISTQEN